ncbi:unnamed protein product, partial [Heterotrigona itama]
MKLVKVPWIRIIILVTFRETCNLRSELCANFEIMIII